MTMERPASWRWLALIALMLGCDTRPSTPPAESAPATPPTATPSAGPAADATSGRQHSATKQQATKQATPAPAAPAGPPAQSPDAAAAKPAPKLKKATVGVGKKGHGYGGGVITEPVRARFRVEERIVFNNVDYAMKLYKAQHDEIPKTHEEFMEKIIRANQIALPTLPTGDEYVYDPDKGELMVRHQQ